MIPSGKSGVYVYRTIEEFGIRMNPEVVVDGMRIGKLVPNGYLRAILKPGRHELSMSYKIDQFTIKQVTHHFTLRPDTVHFAKVLFESHDRHAVIAQTRLERIWAPLYEPKFEKVEPRFALREIAETDYSDPCLY